jgi:rSAM/selenodomain-associated transferase 1
MKNTAVVFARAPRLGAVKRRLAATLGERAALRFHRNTLTTMLRRLAADPRFQTVLAMTPDRERFRAPPKVLHIGQGYGDLGLRMHRAFRRFRRGRAAIVGADIPDAQPTDLALAFRALGTADAAFGPAEDGGYWLVALGPRRPARPFANVRWSSEHALTDTLRNFRGHRVALLRVLQDVDTAEDLERVHKDGRHRSLPPPARSPQGEGSNPLGNQTGIARL